MRELNPFSSLVGSRFARPAPQTERAAPRPVSFARLQVDDDVRRDLEAVAAAVPAAAEILLALAQRRPGLFRQVDPVTRKPLAGHLRAFVEAGGVRSRDVPGFARFLRNVATFQYGFRVSGYSHAAAPVQMFLLNHPGLVLDFISAAREGRSVPLRHLYEGDGIDAFPPTRELANGFGFVDRGVLGYEQGFVAGLVQLLAPDRLLPEHLAARCDPVAVALSRLSGQTVRYHWVFGLRTGEDLLDALDTQQGEGLSLADVAFTCREGDFQMHFPIFFDHDRAAGTVKVQDFSHGPQTVTVDDQFAFATEGKVRPAAYYRPAPGFERFLAVEQQKAAAAAPKEPPSDLRWGERAARVPGGSWFW